MGCRNDNSINLEMIAHQVHKKSLGCCIEANAWFIQQPNLTRYEGKSCQANTALLASGEKGHRIIGETPKFTAARAGEMSPPPRKPLQNLRFSATVRADFEASVWAM